LFFFSKQEYRNAIDDWVSVTQCAAKMCTFKPKYCVISWALEEI
jgi:hypothetical protein